MAEASRLPLRRRVLNSQGRKSTLAECDEENWAGRGRPRQRGPRGGGAARRPSSIPTSNTGRRPWPRLECSGVQWVLGLCLHFSAAWSLVPPILRNAQKRPAGAQEGSQEEQSPKESSRPLPAPPRLLFKAFSPFLSHTRAISLSLACSLSPLET